jgi:Kdo2-lipid IVA lauroyltransferase/acyltransferase
VTFFGRTCRVNPLLARFARLFDCSVRGARIIRLRDGNFLYDITEPLDLPRDRDGRVDVAGSMQMITSIIEQWVREHPDQWMWLHKRWR